MLSEQRNGIVVADGRPTSNERHRRHDVFDESLLGFIARNETHVPIGDDSQKDAVLIHNWKAGHAKLTADSVDFGDRVTGGGRHGVRDHPRFTALDLVDLRRLVLDGQVAVNDADSTLAGHSNRHPRLGDGVHCAGYNRRPQRDAFCQATRGVSFGRNDVGVLGKKHDIVIGQPG